MINTDGHCECGGYIVFESIMTGGMIQMWRCTDCRRPLYRMIDDMKMYRTLEELQDALSKDKMAYRLYPSEGVM